MRTRSVLSDKRLSVSCRAPAEQSGAERTHLCRSFDQLSHGQDYIDIKPVIHIAFLDYSLFPENPEFCASYQLMNPKNNTLYSSNFTLNVIDLTHIDLATEEDKKFHIDKWARLFKATTWEEVHMLAEKNEYTWTPRPIECEIELIFWNDHLLDCFFLHS